jgi:hypothetical protein
MLFFFFFFFLVFKVTIVSVCKQRLEMVCFRNR